MHTTKIYEHANEQHIRAIVIYAVGSDGKAYKDSKGTEQFKNSELKNAFIKGCVIDISGVLYTALNYYEKNKVGTITYVKADTTTATTAVLGTLVGVAN